MGKIKSVLKGKYFTTNEVIQRNMAGYKNNCIERNSKVVSGCGITAEIIHPLMMST